MANNSQVSIYSMVTVMAITTVYFAKQHYYHKESALPVVNITNNISEPFKYNGTSIDNVVYEIVDYTKTEEGTKVKEVFII